MEKELVKDWMTTDVITITPKTALTEAHRLMTDNKVRRLPVMESNQLLGIITLGDVREAEPSGATTLSIWELNYLLAKLTVDLVMTRDPITISPSATLGDAARVMLENKVSGLPVGDDAKGIVGMITESDIFRAVVQKWSED